MYIRFKLGDETSCSYNVDIQSDEHMFINMRMVFDIYNCYMNVISLNNKVDFVLVNVLLYRVAESGIFKDSFNIFHETQNY